QRDIADNILAKKADYVLALKGNQGTLREDVEIFVAEQKANGFTDTKVSRHKTVDGDHGRIETRAYTAFHDIAWLQERHDWPGLKGVVMVESTREIGDKIERETRLYITSLVWLAHQLGPVIRTTTLARRLHRCPRRPRRRRLHAEESMMLNGNDRQLVHSMDEASSGSEIVAAHRRRQAEKHQEVFMAKRDFSE